MDNKIDQLLVTIIIPTKDRTDLLRKCISSIESKSNYRNYEIIVIDNNSEKAESKSYLSSIKHKVVPLKEPYNSAKICNFGAKHTAGEYLIFLNNDTEVISPDWIERMLDECTKPDVGAVGVKLLYPNDTIQHAGVLIGVAGVASHAFEGLPRDHLGYQGFLQSVRKCSAVTGACMMVRKKTLQEVGGFDENLAYAYDDIDFCLRLRKKGYSIVYTPYAELYHHTSSTRPLTVPVDTYKYFHERWRDLILNGDPYYARSLSRVRPYSAKTGEERLILTDLGLFEESHLGNLSTLKRYVKIANMIVKRYGVRRLIVEFARFIQIRCWK